MVDVCIQFSNGKISASYLLGGASAALVVMLAATYGQQLTHLRVGLAEIQKTGSSLDWTQLHAVTGTSDLGRASLDLGPYKVAPASKDIGPQYPRDVTKSTYGDD